MHPALVVPSIVNGFVPLEQLGISHKTYIAMGIALYVVLTAFTILVTGLIAIRLLQVRRQHVNIMGKCLMISPVQ